MSALEAVAVPQPLTLAQEGVWYAEARSPDPATFTTGQVLWLEGPADREALWQAVRRAVDEAGALRLRFTADAEGRPVALAGPAPEVSRREVSRAEAEAGIAAERAAGFDLGEGPLARVTLWQISPRCHAVSQHLHHIVADGYANTLLTRRIAAHYAHAVGQGPEPRAVAGYDAALKADAAYRGAPQEAADRAFWAEQLRDHPGANGFRPGAAVAQGDFLRAEVISDAALPEGLRALAQAAGTNWADCVTALTAAFCARMTEGVSAPGIPLMNRGGGGLGTLVSTQVNVVPLLAGVDEDAPLVDWIGGVAAQLAQMRRHGLYRGEAMRRDLGLIGAGRRLHGPLINVLPFDPTPRAPGLAARLEITGAGSVDDLTFAFRGDGRGPLRLQLDANPALYAPDEVRACLDRLHAFLRRALGAGTLAEVPTLTGAETRLHVETRNATGHPVPETTLTALIEEGLRRDPAAPALIFGGQSMDHATLERRSAALAAALAARGVGPGSRVAVALPRSFELLVALFAVLRAGAAYVPLDPEDDSARRADMLARAAPVLVLAGADFPHDSVLSPEDWPESGTAPAVRIAPQDLAYVLFTSGSTGRPKGVAVSHRAIVNRLLWMRETYAIGPGDRILQKTPATFDVSVWEFFLPVLSGAPLVIAAPGAHRDPVELARLIRAEEVSVAHFVPSMLALFLACPDSAGLRLRHLFASGEALPADLARLCLTRLSTRLHNLYGPTEAAVDVTAQEATGREAGASVPIGRPVWNTRCYVLDARMRPVPDGAPGQLWLGGRQLAEGYLGQPDLTAERFLPDPFHPGERIYATGDIVRQSAAGELTYEGRADGQVKIRGVRIETGEVAAAILATGLVAQAEVQAEAAPGQGARLLAWVTPEVDTDRLAEALAARLPSALQPAAILALTEFPLGATGKLDRKALPRPGFTARGRAAAPGLEAELAALYAEILALPEIPGAGADFFRMGGDSLRAVQFSLSVEERTGRPCGLADIFEAPVLSDLARRIAAASEASDALGPVLHLSSGEGAPLFVIHPAGGIGWCYRSLAESLPGRPVIALQSPLLDPGAGVPDSLSALARDYAARITALCGDGPAHLAGWSLGGLIAQEVAVQLQAAGTAGPATGLVALLDAYPAECWRNQPDPGPEAALRALLAMSGVDPRGPSPRCARAQRSWPS
ncbi:amino acid adenylation domain-containing protein [Oceanicola sp. S124]|uniref:amino acid adenylation domain-containing protein n=1 Tax=Oceanicola sp. S124 TaxID=1042378 RepID=UPI0002F33D78|nr:amino acid adenylation domain-containing protein [Oceanicola sp. S124]